jgi:serine protease AprX
MYFTALFRKADAVVRCRYLLRIGLAGALVCVLVGSPPVYALSGTSGQSGQSGHDDHPKLDRKLNDRERNAKGGTSRAIILLKTGGDVSAEVVKRGGKLGRRLGLVNGMVVVLPNAVLRNLADNPAVDRIVWDRPLDGSMNRVAATVGARAVRHAYGYTGAGVGVAVIDSGVASWHDDLTYQGTSTLVRGQNGQRVPAFVDFVAGRTTPYDDYGHGTHVSGIIAGNGYDSWGARAGIAPDAHLVSLKVLDGSGRGVISNVIAALEWAVANKAAYNIRVINLSVGAAVTESFNTDPLTLAAKRAVDAGIVVVAAAGNFGKNELGQVQYGAITAPGNAPWVLTVGASSTEGTVWRSDDVMASYSSRGPTAIDFQAKPDLVAPGTGVVSLADPTSLLYTTKSAFLLSGTLLLGTKPYLSLSGTSMATPVVAGSVALMFQANPNLTPNLVKAILQYTAQEYPAYNALTEGAGFLNTKGAVDLARFFRTAQSGQNVPSSWSWSRDVLWGNHRITGGLIKPNATAWNLGVVWGATQDLSAKNVTWGTLCPDECDNIVWGTLAEEDNIVWGTASLDEDNIVWGTIAAADEDNIVWGTTSSDEDNIVWGTDCGGANCASVVWGTFSDEDNIVWGTASDEDNIVWGTSGDVDSVVWSTSADVDGGMWGSSGIDNALFDDPNADPVTFDSTAFDDLFGPALERIAAPPPEDAVTTTTTNTLTGVIGGL